MTRMTGRPYDPQRPRDRRRPADSDALRGILLIGGTLVAFFILALTVLR